MLEEYTVRYYLILLSVVLGCTATFAMDVHSADLSAHSNVQDKDQYIERLKSKLTHAEQTFAVVLKEVISAQEYVEQLSTENQTLLEQQDNYKVENSQLQQQLLQAKEDLQYLIKTLWCMSAGLAISFVAYVCEAQKPKASFLEEDTREASVEETQENKQEVKNQEKA
jgi:hypothetical protein